MMPGLALDLTTCEENGRPWDFNDADMRAKAEKRVDDEQPHLLIGTPMCTAFSNIQNLNKARRDPRVVEAELAKARVHLHWCCRLYRKQIARGAYFLHEHPRLATSWRDPEVLGLLATRGVDRVVADQCQLGQQTDSGDPLKKPTGFMSNSEELLRALGRRCFGKHGLCSRAEGGRHAECLGKKAQRAAIFQEELCITILRGFRKQMLMDKKMRNGEVSVVDSEGVMRDADEDVHEYYLSLAPSTC